MKQIFTFLFLLCSVLGAQAAPPTVSSSSFVFSTIDGNRMSVKFTAGNGANRIVVMKAGSAVTGMPVNGAEYTSNLAFGTAGTLFTAANEYVVYKGTSISFIVTNLQPNTVYHLAVFDYNGTAATTQYLMVPLTGSQSTSVTPSTPTGAISFTNITGNSVKLNWASGGGEGRLILARKGGAVNALPVDLTDYTASSDFGTTTPINTDNYAVYKQSSTSVTINNLEPNTTYHFSSFEKNGSSAPVYLRPGTIASVTTTAGPTIPTQSVYFNFQEGNRFTVNSSPGNGERRVFIMRKGAPVTASPANGTAYTASAAFGSGTEMAPGEFVVNYSTGNSVVVTNLEPATTYYVRSFEYDVDAAGNTFYLLTNPANASYSTASPPSPASALNFTSVTGNSLTIKYTAGGGGYRMVIMKEGSAVDAVPVNLVKYTGAGSFGTGAQITPGNYVVNGGANGTQTAVTNLHPGGTYHVAVYEFNGNNYPVYATVAATGTITLPAEPTTSSNTFTKNTIEGNSFRAAWTNGDGARRVVVVRKNTAVTALPVDGQVYTANSNFGQGDAVAADQYVVYDGNNSTCDIKNLEVGTTYHVAVFEYNLSGALPDYLTSAWLAGNGTTLTAPTTQVSALTTVTIQANQATISYNGGNGAGRIFVMREGSPVNTDPVDLTNYSYSNVFGNTQLGIGNYIVQRTTAVSNFTVTNLQPLTQYYIAAYEYNGSSGPVFKRPAIIANFTTTAGSGIVKPTIPASLPVVSAVEGNKFTFQSTAGNGSGRMVVVRAGAPVTFVPTDLTGYTADAAFGNSPDVGSGEYVVYNGTGTNVGITNLQPATVYHFAVFEYNGSGFTARYLTSSFLAHNASTLSAPASGSANLVPSATPNSITLNWQKGNGDNRLVVVKEGSAVTATPVNLAVYPANSAFKSGAQIGAGEYVVFSGSGNSVTVTGLDPQKTYHISIFEYNGTTGPVYNTANVLSGTATTSSVLPLNWVYFNASPRDGHNLLGWGTNSEINTAHFVVERNITGNQFEAIAVIPATTGNGTQHYQYKDFGVFTSSARYRLKQVDKDGRSSYSVIVNCNARATQHGFSFYPNPAKEKIVINYKPVNGKVMLQVYDAAGKQVMQQYLATDHTVLLNQLKAGLYYIILTDGDARYTERLIKQE